jgi:hypothetical protein
VERDFEPPAKPEKAIRMSTLLALYGRPDQLIPIMSGLTAIFAFVLMFWNKALVLLGKILNRFRFCPPAESPSTPTAEPLATPKRGGLNDSRPEIT